MKKHLFNLGVICIAFVLAVLSLTGCKKQHIDYTTTTDVNIVDYLRRYPDQYSEFVKMLDRTNISPFLNAYGAYTCFAPTNAAVKAYLKKIGKNSTDEIDTATLKNICKLHLIQDTITTQLFTDGKMITPTMFGQYLITGVNNTGATVVNRQAIIIQPNIYTGNGYIHAIDNVLEAAQLTIAKMIEQNSRYGIFTQALKVTGFYDSLNIVNNPDTTRKWLTLLAEPDSVYKTIGINTYADLVKKYSNTGNPKNPNDSLFLYVAYHILPDIKYVADIVSAPSHPTLAPLNVITALLNNQTVLLNQATFNNIVEPGVPVDRAYSDNSCTNGVLNALDGDIYIKLRVPTPVYWDVCDQPELRKVVSAFRKTGQSIVMTYGYCAGITWQNSAISMTYSVMGATEVKAYPYWNDFLSINIRTPSNQNQWIEFTTPLIVKGKYKVWICYRTNTQGKYTQVTFDGNPLSRIVDFTVTYDKNATDAVNEANGLKLYSSTAPVGTTFCSAQLAGVVDIATTDLHKIRLSAIKDAGQSTTNVGLDMIQFIPVNMDQQYPRFGIDGSVKLTP